MRIKKEKVRKGKQTFAERFFPARPNQLWVKARKLALTQIDVAYKIGLPRASNSAYTKWLKKESMLAMANRIAESYSGTGAMWQNSYAKPRPRTALKLASVWYTAYPASVITKAKTSIIGTLGDEELWKTFEKIGIRAIHTGPMKRAGGIRGWDETPSIDGHFDRISNHIDGAFGTEAEFRHMSAMATQHGAIVIDDVVPGHTGKGADFQLATMKSGEYPGIYHMVEIGPEDWDILPDVPKGRDSVNLSEEVEAELKNRRYIIGKLRRVIFYEPGVKETNWSVTQVVKGIDGVRRRWVYLHYFKDGQPSINWLDPSFAGMKLVVGDALHSIGHLGSKAVRLDANGFLGIEKSEEDKPAWSEGHPLSEAANQLISGMVRKVGGFTFQELNLSIDDIKNLTVNGADLSYDFITRPAYQHALITGDTEFLRLMLRLSTELGIESVSLVHALQNHDDLTTELVHFWTIHKDDDYQYHDQTIKGIDLRSVIRNDINSALVSDNISYNLPFVDNGVACTTVSLITAVLGYTDISQLSAWQIGDIKKAHLLLAAFNALQPGVFALSGWDLCGSLPLDPATISELVSEGDTRWINRGAYDLMGSNPNATQSFSGLPLATNLYGSLPDQMKDKTSFVRHLQRMLELRETYAIPTSRQVDVPDVSHKAMLVMVHSLDDDVLQATVLNFSNETINGRVKSEVLPADAEVIDMFTDQVIGAVDDLHGFAVTLEPYEVASFLIKSKR